MSDLSTIQEDKALLQRIANGDEKAFCIVYDKYHNLLGSHIFRITKSHELAQEVVQDVFLKVWKNSNQLSDVRDFKAYLFVISKNHALNCLKQIVQEKTCTSCLEEHIDYLVDDYAEENQHYILIDEAIDHLPPRQREVYLMSRHERLKYAEIASRLSLSRETVKKYLQISSESITTYIRKRLSMKSLIIFIFFF